MYFSTLGNDRVANERLTPDVHETSKPSDVEDSPSIRRRRTGYDQHLITGVLVGRHEPET
jgi:hypothetical protein